MPEKWNRKETYNWDTGEYEYKTDEPDVYILASDHGGDGHDWSVLAVVAREIGDTWEYAVYGDGGCSCNSAYEQSPEFYDFAWNNDPRAVFASATADMTVSERAYFRVEFNQSLKELANARQEPAERQDR